MGRAVSQLEAPFTWAETLQISKKEEDWTVGLMHLLIASSASLRELQMWLVIGPHKFHKNMWSLIEVLAGIEA